MAIHKATIIDGQALLASKVTLGLVRFVDAENAGLDIGNAVRFDGSDWVKAIADTEANARGAGIVVGVAPGTGYVALDSYTKLMLHLNSYTQGAGYISLVDHSPEARSIIAEGYSSINTADPKFGAGCIDLPSFAGSPIQDYSASANYNFGTDDFTVDFWMKTTNTAQKIFHMVSAGLYDRNLSINFNDSGYDYYHFWAGGGTNHIRGTLAAITDGDWHHHAIVRSSGTMMYFVDGVLIDSNSSASQSIGADTSGFTFGASNGDVLYDEIRLSKGIARWTAGFAPPETEYGLATLGFYFQKLGVADVFSGLTPGTRYYLSDTTAGALTSTAPTVAVPILDAVSASGADLVCR